MIRRLAALVGITPFERGVDRLESMWIASNLQRQMAAAEFIADMREIAEALRIARNVCF